MSQQVFVLLFLISKMSLYEKFSANHKTHFDLSNHRSYFISDIVHFSEIKGAISYQIIVTIFLFPPPPLKILTLSHGQNRLSIPTYSRFLFFLSWSLFFVRFFIFEYTSERQEQTVSCVWSRRAGWEEAGRDESSCRWSRAPNTGPGMTPRPHQAPHTFLLFFVCVPYWPLWDLPEELPSEPAGLIFFMLDFQSRFCMKRTLCSFKKQETWKLTVYSWTALLPERPSPPPPSASLAASLVRLASVFPSQLTVPKTLCLALLTFPQSSHGAVGGSIFGMLLWTPVYQHVCNYLLIRKTCAGPDRPHVCGLSHP